jgi:hypothetical protein
LLDKYLDDVKSFLKSQRKAINVVVMPDFFIDRFITIDTSPEQFLRVS